MSYVDLHLHLLPGVDDGARDDQEALAHVRRLAAEGVREVVATPHVNGIWELDVSTIPERVRDLRRLIDAEGLGVRVQAGGELHPERVPSLCDAELDLLAQGPPGSRWLLLESPFEGLDDTFAECCEELRRRGFGIVIAHPERAGADYEEALRAQLAAGAVAQVNVCSLLGNHGLAVQERAADLLRRGLAYVIASDGHPGTREQTLQLGLVLALRAGASSVQAWRLTQANPRFLLAHGIPRVPSMSAVA
jgi:protein-tyrosine phosphatase